MKLTTLLVASSWLCASAFGVSPSPALTKTTGTAFKKPVAFRKDTAIDSPLFRDPTVTRGGAVPGWAAYNEALDKNPLTAKAFTSLVGWALGDFLAQVCCEKLYWYRTTSACGPLHLTTCFASYRYT